MRGIPRRGEGSRFGASPRATSRSSESCLRATHLRSLGGLAAFNGALLFRRWRRRSFLVGGALVTTISRLPFPHHLLKATGQIAGGVREYAREVGSENDIKRARR
jgi:hypothetical protein